MIRRLGLLAGLWCLAVVPAAATPILDLPPAPCHCDWTIVNDPTDDPIQTIAEIEEDRLHEGEPAYVLVCDPPIPSRPGIPVPFGIPVLPGTPIPPTPGTPVPFGFPPVLPPGEDPPPVDVAEPGTGLLLLAALGWTWTKARR